jgi:hypothetical protein
LTLGTDQSYELVAVPILSDKAVVRVMLKNDVLVVNLVDALAYLKRGFDYGLGISWYPEQGIDESTGLVFGSHLHLKYVDILRLSECFLAGLKQCLDV